MKASTSFQIIGFLDHKDEDQYSTMLYILDSFGDNDTLIPVKISKKSKTKLPNVKNGDLLWIHGELYGKEYNDRWFLNMINVKVGVIHGTAAKSMGACLKDTTQEAAELKPVDAPTDDAQADNGSSEPSPYDVPF